MSVTKDTKTGKWMSQIRITDWQGKTVHKKKRGFSTKREALEWERDFISRNKGSVNMKFGDFLQVYLNDMSQRLKHSTLENKRYMIELKIAPYFSKMPINEIKPTDIRDWQNSLTSYRDEKGNGYSQTYLKAINNQITAIFNYAVKYYDLRENPCHKAGSIGKKNADEMSFWTKPEFEQFIEAVKDKQLSYTLFMTLYYTGIREGEVLALTPADIDFDKKTITINKSYQRLNKEDIITTPKTPKSNRVIVIPQFLCDCLKDYISHCYELQPTDRLFPCTKYYLSHEMDRGCKKSGVKRIRVHDIRHSHASLLVEMGFSPLLIAERLGHEKVQTTMETYSHLYPNKQAEVAEKLDGDIKIP
ncbi:MAG: site-specific integrase [Oscillospiraceae bacterium]|nr:site-specific integrase [Oscillospiraceae bacterium]